MDNIYSFYIAHRGPNVSIVHCLFCQVVFDDILYTHYILIYSRHNGDDAPQNSLSLLMMSTMYSKHVESYK